ncbi:MAG: hypothetical protein ACM3U2_15130 [Deltaproteobacteria bacterium]
MTGSRRPRCSAIVAIALFLPLIYVAAFGPASWLASRYTNRNELVDALYWPIGWAKYDGSAWISRPLAWYGELGMPAGTRWHLRAELARDFESGSFVLVGTCPF